MNKLALFSCGHDGVSLANEVSLGPLYKPNRQGHRMLILDFANWCGKGPWLSQIERWGMNVMPA